MKVIVRHSPGAGGHFIAALIRSLIEPINSKVTREGSAHNHNVYSTHNYDELAHGNVLVRDPAKMQTFKMYTEEPYYQQHPDATDGIQWFKENLKFADKGLISAYGKEWHFVRTHARVLDSLIPAIGIDDTRLINITMTDDDIDQLSYNFVIKTILPNPNWVTERAYDCLVPLHYWYPDKQVTVEQLHNAVATKDIKFLNWVIKLAWLSSWKKYQMYKPPVEFYVLDIGWSEILDRSIINRLDEIAELLGISIDGYARHNAIEFINEYAAAQTTVPHTVSIDDF